MTAPHVLITGASAGIGLAAAQGFAALGYRVTGLARRARPEWSLPGASSAVLVPFDLEQTGGIAALVEELGPVDVLVNNAGIMCSAPWDAYPEESRRRTLAVNLESPVALIRAVAPGMLDRGGGRVVNVSSIAGQMGHPDIWYGMTKAALLSATRSFARLLGPGGVLVNAVAPGPVETAMLASIPEARKAQIAGSVMTGRFARPEEVAEVIVWLGTRSPAYVNGSTLDVNDGAYLR
ncbi:MAG: SDR family oxidoreductase [Deltaproteobacteria bacterium]|nr:MAG: SDR family oxidoreductase [Deltaproteobacteria bacterium]